MEELPVHLDRVVAIRQAAASAGDNAAFTRALSEERHCRDTLDETARLLEAVVARRSGRKQGAIRERQLRQQFSDFEQAHPRGRGGRFAPKSRTPEEREERRRLRRIAEERVIPWLLRDKDFERARVTEISAKKGLVLIEVRGTMDDEGPFTCLDIVKIKKTGRWKEVGAVCINDPIIPAFDPTVDYLKGERNIDKHY